MMLLTRNQFETPHRAVGGAGAAGGQGKAWWGWAPGFSRTGILWAGVTPGKVLEEYLQ